MCGMMAIFSRVQEYDYKIEFTSQHRKIRIYTYVYKILSAHIIAEFNGIHAYVYAQLCAQDVMFSFDF